MQSIEETDIDSLDELVAIFLAGFPSKVRELETALAASDTKQLDTLLHQLKGSAGGYGFIEITDLAANARKTLLTDGSVTDAVKKSVELLAQKCNAARATDSTLLT